MPRKFDKESVCCGVCMRSATGIFYGKPKNFNPVLWLCEHPGCIPLGREVFHMAHHELNMLEKRALLGAGDAAGAYLESIGKFDLSQLTPQEWETFLGKVLLNYGEQMRKLVADHVAPF